MLLFYANVLLNENQRDFILSFYHKHKRKILGYAIGISSNAAWAEDALDSAFLTMIERITSFQSMKEEEIHRYIYTVIKNKWIKDNKKESSAVYYGVGDAELADQSSLEERYILNASIHTLKEEIKKLPQTHQDVIRMFYMLQYTHKQIAELLGITENNSAVVLNRAVKMLRKRLSEVFQDEY